MPSSRPTGAVVSAVGLGAVGLLVAGSALAASSRSLVLAVAGLTLLAIGAAIWLSTSPPRPERVSATLTGSAEEPAVRLALRPHLPLANLLVFGALVTLGLAGMFAIGLGEGGLLLLPVILLCALPLPDTIRALARRPHLLLSQVGLELRGWGIDAGVGWDDVAAVGVATPHPRRPVLRVSGRPGAPSYHSRVRRWILALDARPAGEYVDVRLQALDNPGALEVVLQEMTRFCPADRRAFLAADAVPLLTSDLRQRR